MATVRSVSNILGEFFAMNFDKPEYQELFDHNDIGFPLAFHIYRGMAAPTDLTAQYLNETWLEFCNIFDIDPLNDFETLGEFLEFDQSVS